MACFGVSGIGPSVSVNRKLVNYLTYDNGLHIVEILMLLQNEIVFDSKTKCQHKSTPHYLSVFGQVSSQFYK